MDVYNYCCLCVVLFSLSVSVPLRCLSHVLPLCPLVCANRPVNLPVCTCVLTNYISHLVLSKQDASNICNVIQDVCVSVCVRHSQWAGVRLSDRWQLGNWRISSF